MKQDLPRPKNWQSAASLTLDSVFDLARIEFSSEKMDADVCMAAVIEQFEYVVEEVFNDNGYELDGPLEHMYDIAAYALTAYADISGITRSRAINHIFETLVDKQKMYGPKNVARFGLRGIVVRLNDKVERLINLKQHQGPVLFEPEKDTWLDIVGYSVIAIMWINDWFLLPMKIDSASKKTLKEQP